MKNVKELNATNFLKLNVTTLKGLNVTNFKGLNMTTFKGFNVTHLHLNVEVGDLCKLDFLLTDTSVGELASLEEKSSSPLLLPS